MKVTKSNLRPQITIECTFEEAAVLYRICGMIRGSYNRPRRVADAMRDQLENIEGIYTESRKTNADGSIILSD